MSLEACVTFVCVDNGNGNRELEGEEQEAQIVADVLDGN